MFMARRDEHSESSLMMPKSILHESGQSITQAAEDKAIVRFKGQRRGDTQMLIQSLTARQTKSQIRQTFLHFNLLYSSSTKLQSIVDNSN